MSYLIAIVIALVLGMIGLVFGSINERRHYRSIEQREVKYQHIKVFNGKRPLFQLTGQSFSLVQGSVVISSDRFKNILAFFRHLFGGNIRSYEALLERARREALLRMKQQAAERGAHSVMGVLFETSTLNQTGLCCELLAYGTALGGKQLVSD